MPPLFGFEQLTNLARFETGKEMTFPSQLGAVTSNIP
jgi:hypothetical protein